MLYVATQKAKNLSRDILSRSRPNFHVATRKEIGQFLESQLA